MFITRLLLLALGALLPLPLPVGACDTSEKPWPARTLCQLAGKADMVLVGTVQGVKRHGELDLGAYDRASVRVECVFKDAKDSLQGLAEAGAGGLGELRGVGPFGPHDLCYSEVEVGERHLLFLGDAPRKGTEHRWVAKYSNGPHSAAVRLTPATEAAVLAEVAACEGHQSVGVCTAQHGEL